MTQSEHGQRQTRPGKEVALSEYQLGMGQRMKQAAQRAGFITTQQMAAQVGVASGTISRWWRGVRRPSDNDLALYAAATGVTLEWLLTATAESDADRLEQILLRIVDLAMAGQTLGDAFAAVTGVDDQIGRRDRETLSKGTPAVRDGVTRLAGAAWEAASPDQRRQAVGRLYQAATRPWRER